MENHPIPQDVTGFQFKLIGNMTIKQFAYLAGGIVLAWVCYILPVHILFKLPFSFFFALLGVAFAFLPFEGRPLDLMITNFAKALINPTQFLYQKVGREFYVPQTQVVSQPQTTNQQTSNPMTSDRLKKYLEGLPLRPKNKLDQKEMIFFQSLANLNYGQPQPAPQLTPVAPPPHAFAQQDVEQSDVEIEEIKPVKDNSNQHLSSAAENIKKELQEAKKEEEKQAGSANYSVAHEKVLELEKLLNDTMGQKQALEHQLAQLQKKLETEKKDIYSPTVAVNTQQEKPRTKNVRSIPKGMGKTVGLPITPEFPNIITGIIKDPRNNPLPNILVEVKDREGNPVRAFKTNPLGHFASATPLINGIYTIEFEDPKNQNKFDTIEIEAKGEIILPIEVISIDSREELRKSLFN